MRAKAYNIVVRNPRRLAKSQVPSAPRPQTDENGALLETVRAKRASAIVGPAAPGSAEYLEVRAEGAPNDRAHRDRIPAIRRDPLHLTWWTFSGHFG